MSRTNRVILRPGAGEPAPAPPTASLDPPALFLGWYGLFSTVFVADMPPVLPMLVGLMLLPGWYVSRRVRVSPSYGRLWAVVSLAFMGIVFAMHLAGEFGARYALAIICSQLLLHRWFVPRRTRDYIEIWGLSVVLMLLGSLEGRGLLALLLLVGWGLSSVQLFVCLGLYRTRRELADDHQLHEFAPRSMRAAWGILPLGAILALGFFYTIPRVDPPRGSLMEGNRLAPSERAAVMAGFNDTITLRGMTTIRETDALALRIIDPPALVEPEQLQLRVTTLDAFDGWEWSRTPLPERDISLMETGYRLPEITEGVAGPSPASTSLGAYWIRFHDYPGSLVPLPEATVAIGGVVKSTPATLGHDGRVLFGERRLPTEIQVFTTPQLAEGRRSRLRRGPVLASHLEIPPELAEAVRGFRVRLVGAGEGAPDSTARRATAWLRRHGVYTLELPEAEPGPDVLRRFMEGTPRGHCELHATALALVLRDCGIPTRLVTGFQGAELAENPPEGTERVLRVPHRNAHAWVEAHLGGGEWVALDPTPSTLFSHVPQTTAGGPLRMLFEEKTNVVVGAIEGYGRTDQERLIQETGMRMRRALEQWEGGALVRAWARIRRNATEPGILVAAALLVALNGGAWWLRRRIRRLPAQGPAGAWMPPSRAHSAALLREILEALRAGANRATPAGAPTAQERILAAAGAAGVDKDLAAALAATYNRWRYGADRDTAFLEIRSLLRAVRRAPAGRG